MNNKDWDTNRETKIDNLIFVGIDNQDDNEENEMERGIESETRE